MKQRTEQRLSSLGIGFLIVATLIAGALFLTNSADRSDTQAPTQRDQFAH